jgi:uncharacterized HAD superfamily protein
MNIYIDMDDVLCDTAGAYAELLAREFGRTVAFEDIFSFNLQKSFGLSDEEYRRLFERGHEPDFIAGLRPLDGMLPVLDSWQNRGHRISVVTGRHTSAWSQSLKWLEQHKVPYHSFIVVDKYDRSDTDHSVAISLEELTTIGFDIGIEDSTKMADFISSRMRMPLLLFDRPWNKKYEAAPQMTRCCGWEEVGTALENMQLMSPGG